MRLSALAISATVLLASSACSGGGTPNSATTPSTGPGQASSLTPSAAIPTSPDQLPDPAPTAPPVGSKVLFTGSGKGARDLTLPASAGKASYVSVSWSCAGPAKFNIVSSGKTLAASECGDGSAIFAAEIPRALIGDRLAWKFTTDSSVLWRVNVLQPSEN